VGKKKSLSLIHVQRGRPLRKERDRGWKTNCILERAGKRQNERGKEREKKGIDKWIHSSKNLTESAMEKRPTN